MASFELCDSCLPSWSVTVAVLVRQEDKKDGEEEEEVKVDTFKFIGVRRLKGECLVRTNEDKINCQ